MHIKRAYLAEQNEPLVHIVRPGQGVKTASRLLPSVQGFIDSLEPDPRYTYALTLAMGNSWYYGANSNRDWYGYNPHLDFDGLLHAWEGIGRDYETDRMRAKAWPYGYPCFLNSTVYAHHKNTDPQGLGFGDVLFSVHNPEMKRIELIERIFNDEARKKGHTSILERMAAGERVDVSMGAKVPFDLCSVCSDWEEIKKAWKTFDAEKHAHPGIAILAYHKTVKSIRGLAITRKDYCKCMRESPGKILPDGRKIFVYNDFPRFFDISFVIVGADRTARVMWHMTGSAIPAKPKTSDPRDLLAEKAAGIRIAMDKRIPGGYAAAIHADAETAPDFSELLSSQIGDNKTKDTARVLAALAVLGVVPSPKEFQGLVLETSAEGRLLKSALDLRGLVFDTTSGGVDDTFAVDPSAFDIGVAEKLSELLVERSSWDPFLTARLTSLRPKTASKICKPSRTALLDKISAQYNGYRISVFENAPDLFPKTAGLLSSAQVLGANAKGIGAGALLLGLGPVISLLSAHLQRGREEGQQIGNMASFVADNPSFVTITTIGAGLRAAMKLSESGGLTQALSSLVAAARGVL